MTIDELIPDPKCAKEFGVTLMTLWRWDHSPAKAKLGWPPAVKIGRRNFRSRRLLEEFKAGLIRRALKEREAAA